MKINPGNSKAQRFTKARVKERIRLIFWDQLILENNSFKYLVIISGPTFLLLFTVQYKEYIKDTKKS
jgi:hypothetical protein